MSVLALFLASMAQTAGVETAKVEEPTREINVWVARDVAPGPKIQLNINTRNVPRVHVDAYRVDGEAWLQQRERNGKVPPISGPPAAKWDATVEQKGQRRSANDNYFSRQVNLPPLKPGVYRLEVSGSGVSKTAMVNITNLAVVLKRSPYKGLAWVTDFKTGKVVPGAEVRTFDLKGNLVQRAVTGADGAALFPISWNSGVNFTVIRRGNDLAGLGSAAMNPDGKLKAHFQTDRPIYRPGQTASYKVILRRTNGQGYLPVKTGDVRLTLRDPRDNPLEEVHVQPNAMGSIAGSFQIPQEGMTGPYTLVVHHGNEDAYQTITVAAYRKPEFKVEAAAQQKRYLGGEKVRYVVDSAYYFGAPVPQAEIQWIVRRNPLAFSMRGPEDQWFYGGDGNMYPNDTYASEPVAGSGRAVTDNNGKAVIEVVSDPKAPDMTYSLEAVVTDNSRRQVTGNASVPVYAAARRIGLSSAQGVTALGRLIPVQIRAVDLDGRPVGGEVRLKLIEQYWDEKAQTQKERVLADRTVAVPSNGHLSTTLPAKEEGDLEIRATMSDGTGRVARTSMNAYVAGLDYRADPDEDSDPMVEVKLDRRVYGLGQTGTAYLATNRPKRPSLMVIEGRDIFEYRVHLPGKGARTWSFRTRSELSPNVYLSHSMWTEYGLMSGLNIVPVPDPSRQIKVEAVPSKREVRPGDPVRIAIRTTDPTGRAVPAEVALSVVDEAIYALSPDNTADTYQFYWGMRESHVNTTSSSPVEVSGGAYQRSNAVVPVRQRFEDTAYWNAFVTTGPTGEGFAEFEAPGNLTSWRITARGITPDTRAGMDRENILATRPLTLRLATPRQVAQGDRFTLIGTVNNRSSEAVTLDVTVEPEGIEIPGGAKKLTVPAKSEAKVQWQVEARNVPPSGRFALLARANGPSADTSDALQVSVPVVPKGVRETAVKTGTIQEAATVDLDLPNDALSDSAYLTLRVFAGVVPAANDAATRILKSGRYGSPSAANGLFAVSALGLKGHEADAKESLALLSRTQHPDGWGWWENSPSEPVITARVGHALAEARRAGIRVFDPMWDAAMNSARAHYDRTGLWEQRAQLAATLAELGERNAGASIREVIERGQSVSPYGWLRMAESVASSDRATAKSLLDRMLKLVSDGEGSAFIPVGEGIGWTASERETTAQLLMVLVAMRENPDLQRLLANRLAGGNAAYRSSDEDAAVARALARYAKAHPQAREVGKVTATIGDRQVELTPSTVDPSAHLEIPSTRLPLGPIRLERSGGGEAFYTATLRYYRNLLTENATGIRVSRRYEVRNAANVWQEVDRPIRPNEPVRCTVVVWGDDRSDAIRVTQPIPTGFEFVDAEQTSYAEQDVRDGAVVHYLVNAGAPVYFRYYLRAESEGSLTVLPATAEYLRRPGQRGQTGASPVVVRQ